MKNPKIADRVRYTRTYRFLGTSGGTVTEVMHTIEGRFDDKVRVAWDSGSTTVNFTYELQTITN